MGRAIAGKLAGDGFDVAVAYAGDTDQADATVARIAGHGRRGAAFAAYIAGEKAVSDLFDAIEYCFGHIDVVVNTARINHPAPLTDLDPADCEAIHRVNMRGTSVVGQQAARGLREGGSIVKLAALPPLECLGRSDDIAGVVSFLAGRAAGGSTVRWCMRTADSSDHGE